ncbi:hypothetical protein [uncultured Sphingomonas sp.]|uniref:hypothetical protein n=1 Tax=uncultured Sphingomonas sp. TaxID=158754 RepID=UPI0025F21CEE|nr:hypothetical protein [uncultured Sphingomonas sp.]
MSFFVFLAELVVCCGYALIRGGPPERVGAGLLVGAFALGFPVHLALGADGFLTANVALMAIDVALLAALVVLAHRSTRFWPLWVAGWQLASVIAHVAKVLDPTMHATGYAIQAQIWGYPMVLAIAIGTARHRRRRRSGGTDPAWKTFPI